MSTKEYSGHSVLVSYMMKHSNQSSYRGFLDLHRNEISASSTSNNWSDLDTTWARRFLKEAEILSLDCGALYAKVKLERRGNAFEPYWSKIIAEQKKNKKHPVIEEKENVKSQPKKKLKHISINSQSSEKLSLSSIVLNTLPDLIYLELDKSDSSTKSTEQRFPDKITNWKEFKQEIQRWKLEDTNEYQIPIFRLRDVICENDIWTSSETNIYDTLTPCNRSIKFYNGSFIKGKVGKPDHVIVDENNTVLIIWECKTKWVLTVPLNCNIVTLYHQEKESQEGLLACSKDASIYDPINQTYGYMCANKLKYGVLSTYDQTWFLKRGVIGKNYGWLQVSDAITNSSTNPTLLKSVAYIINLASNDRYAPFLKKPTMVADDSKKDYEDDSFLQKKDDKEFKYKGCILQNGPNVLTRSQSRQALRSLDTNVE